MLGFSEILLEFPKIFLEFPENFPGVLEKDVTFLLKMACLVPGSTAVVEASWSIMKLICDTHSAHLSQEHMNILMHITLNKLEVDFDKVLSVWKEMRPRRIDGAMRRDQKAMLESDDSGDE